VEPIASLPGCGTTAPCFTFLWTRPTGPGDVGESFQELVEGGLAVVDGGAAAMRPARHERRMTPARETRASLAVPRGQGHEPGPFGMKCPSPAVPGPCQAGNPALLPVIPQVRKSINVRRDISKEL
jgi:hypothetical protein